MNSSRGVSTKQQLVIIWSAVVGIILLSGFVMSSTGRWSQKEEMLPIVKDSSGAFDFISLEKTSDLFVMRMKNTSNKAITAYAKAVCSLSESSTDYSIGDYSIQPGATVEIATPVKAVKEMCGSITAQPTITIVAVVFDDRSIGGELQWGQGILDDRRGNKIQLKRINKLLTKAMEEPDAGEPAAIDRLKTEIASLPVDEQETPAVQGGLSNAKQRALQLLGELEQWHHSVTTQSMRNVALRGELAGIGSFKEGIDKLKKLNEKWISKY
jgi:hypothetical protein